MDRLHKVVVMPHHLRERVGPATDPKFIEATLLGEWETQEMFSGNIIKRCFYQGCLFIVHCERNDVIFAD